MGTLVAWHYPTAVLLKLADHTYVTCGNGGKAWGCWGGTSGGSPLRQGNGSTVRADAIAEPDGRANIKCYLVNGVCHQAANRILSPARIIVLGARGYWISEALFGSYGRPRGFLGFCSAPFYQHPDLTGDLAECGGPTQPMELHEPGVDEQTVATPALAAYLSRVSSAYREITPLVATESIDDEGITSFQMTLFHLMTEFKLGSHFPASPQGRELISQRQWLEERRRAIEADFLQERIGVQRFVQVMNELTIEFQQRSHRVLTADQYRVLYELPPEEKVVVGDPQVAQAAYPER
jgi:hypothetical protein